MIRGQKYDFPVFIGNPEHQHFALETSDPFWREVDDCNYLAPDQGFRFVVRRNLGAGSPRPNFPAKIHRQFYGGLSGFRERLGLDDSADPDVYLLEVFPAYLDYDIPPLTEESFLLVVYGDSV